MSFIDHVQHRCTLKLFPRHIFHLKLFNLRHFHKNRFQTWKIDGLWKKLRYQHVGLDEKLI